MGNIGLIWETEHWRVVLAEKQTYLGRCAVDLKRDGGSLSELTEEEWADFAMVVRRLERAITKAFGAKMFNWTCLMNKAFQLEEPHPHVHWHCRPRYDRLVHLAGVHFADPNFGHHYNRIREAQDKSVKKWLAADIIKEVKKHLS